MSFRREIKLSINPSQIFELKKWLSQKGFQKAYKDRLISSLYFENISNKTFLDSEEGTVPRKKIRIRNYPLDTNFKDHFFEVKISSVEGRFKNSKKISHLSYEKFVRNGYDDEDYGICHPKLYVNYLRQYFKLNNLRITLDSNIKYADFKNNNLLFNDNYNAVEIKTDLNTSIDDLYKEFPYQNIRFSKYCRGFEKLYF